MTLGYFSHPFPYYKIRTTSPCHSMCNYKFTLSFLEGLQWSMQNLTDLEVSVVEAVIVGTAETLAEEMVATVTETGLDLDGQIMTG